MKRRIVFTSVVTIVLCLCILTGSTFALFTSEDKVNIAVTAGAVNLTASVTAMKVYTDFSDLPNFNATTDYVNGVAYKDENGSDGYYFENGGTAVLSADNRTLSLSNITPGDAVDLTITLNNYSNVEVKYLVRCTIATSAGTQELEVLVNGKDVTQAASTDATLKSDYRSDWTKMDPTKKTETVPVTVLLPATVGNEYQGHTAEITITVYAIQDNVTETRANTQFGLN